MKLSGADFTVVCAAYNAAAFIEEAINSVLSQRVRPGEIVVVNDGSTDNTATILQTRFARDVRLVNQANQGAWSARNQGISLVRTRWIAFLDADDFWLPEKLELQIDYLESFPECVLVSSDAWYWDGSKRWRHPSRAPNTCGDHFRRLFRQNFMIYSSTNARTDVVKQFSGFREYRNCEDYDLWLRIAAEHPIGFIPEPLILYRRHPQSKSGNTERQCKTQIKIIDNFVAQNQDKVPQWLHRMKRADLQFRMAYHYLREAKYNEAVRFSSRALIANPVHFKNAIIFLLSIVCQTLRWLGMEQPCNQLLKRFL